MAKSPAGRPNETSLGLRARFFLFLGVNTFPQMLLMLNCNGPHVMAGFELSDGDVNVLCCRFQVVFRIEEESQIEMGIESLLLCQPLV